MKKVAIVQSNYIPWKGYFDLIAYVDEFILYDDMQYTRRDWRNRNKIKTPQGLQWLTVPVKVAGKYHQKIKDTEIDGNSWAVSHWRSLIQNYRRSNYFNEISELLEPIYCSKTYTHLSQLNRRLIEEICCYLNIDSILSNSWDYKIKSGRTERLVDICIQSGADEYISGPAAKDYIEDQLFAVHGIKLSWFDYDGYPEYPQLWGAFEHGVTIVDLLFNCGKDAGNFMRYVSS
ncbi:MAG: hypothetical protein CSA23_02830 [Deltaproteobacteria bacterium]|nr:MAG: hypothetical protein CSA23_02830 [Deltaproteobacteria bacterium]